MTSTGGTKDAKPIDSSPSLPLSYLLDPVPLDSQFHHRHRQHQSRGDMGVVATKDDTVAPIPQSFRRRNATSKSTRTAAGTATATDGVVVNVLLEIPMRYETKANILNDETTTSGEAAAATTASSSAAAAAVGSNVRFTVVPKSRLVAVTSIPLVSLVSSSSPRHASNTNNAHTNKCDTQSTVHCNVTLDSTQCGRTGTANGSINLQWKNTKATESNVTKSNNVITDATLVHTATRKAEALTTPATSTTTTWTAGLGSTVPVIGFDSPLMERNTTEAALPSRNNKITTSSSSIRCGVHSSRQNVHPQRQGRSSSSSSQYSMGAHLCIPVSLIATPPLSNHLESVKKTTATNTVSSPSLSHPLRLAPSSVVVSASTRHYQILRPYQQHMLPNQQHQHQHTVALVENHSSPPQPQRTAIAVSADVNGSTSWTVPTTTTNGASFFMPVSMMQASVSWCHRRLECNVPTSGSSSIRNSNAAAASTGVEPQWTLRCGVSHGNHGAAMTNGNGTFMVQPTLGLSVQSLCIPSTFPMRNCLPFRFKQQQQYRTSPKLLDLSVQWRGGGLWQLGGVWRTNNNNINRTSASNSQSGTSEGVILKRRIPRRVVGMSVTFNSLGAVTLARQRSSCGGGLLSWIITWTEGDVTLRIPIQWVTTSATASSILYQQAFQYVYLSFLSSILQDVIGRYFMSVEADQSLQQNGSGADKQIQYETKREKVKQEAVLQQSFMERQAKARLVAEQEGDGLVIQRAVYYVRRVGFDEGNGPTKKVALPRPDANWDDFVIHLSHSGVVVDSLDVTIPLQFWVHDSKLELYGTPNRGQLLGFCDLAALVQLQISTTEKSNATTTIEAPPLNWLQEVRRFLGWTVPATAADSIPFPDTSTIETNTTLMSELFVQFVHKGRSSVIVVCDGDDVMLPVDTIG